MTDEDVDPAAVLALPMQDNDANAATVRDYLVKLLAAVWAEGECFSVKRPFGNSGWHFDVYTALARGGLVTATFDEVGWLDMDSAAEGRADQLIAAAIRHLGGTNG